MTQENSSRRLNSIGKTREFPQGKVKEGKNGEIGLILIIYRLNLIRPTHGNESSDASERLDG